MVRRFSNVTMSLESTGRVTLETKNNSVMGSIENIGTFQMRSSRYPIRPISKVISAIRYCCRLHTLDMNTLHQKCKRSFKDIGSKVILKI